MAFLKHEPGLGLCFSGGGFRASFYHFGALARMAEMGMLRHVEVISTVSGGSIIGAAYYLKLKSLLESTADNEIQDQDYVNLVDELEAHFLNAVQNNLRLRTFADPMKNIRMTLPNYSRSDAIGELYDRYIYQPLIKLDTVRSVRMTDLLIKPKNAGDAFHPAAERRGNKQRAAKVPILILNATSLNTGHDWYFTATSMGEVPPRNINFRDIDKKDRYRRVRYDEITSRKPYFPLGKAVAASAGVPGLFPPMAVSKLYKDRRVQLVDGGVFDNQGINGLLDPDYRCRDFIVSDASGQAEAVDNPDISLFKVLGYTNEILMGRLREESVNSLLTRYPDNVAYFHLTRGLLARRIEFNEQESSDALCPKMSEGITPSKEAFNVDADMQRALSHIRTDLDSFTDVEARALQADAYQMAQPDLKKLAPYIANSELQHAWRFSDYIDLLANKDESLLRHIQVAKRKFFKAYRLMGEMGMRKALGLILISIPVILSILFVLWVLYKLPIWFVDANFWQEIMNKPYSLEMLLGSLAGVLIFYAISVLADRIHEGSGKWIRTIRSILKLPFTVISVLVMRLLLPVLFSIPIWIYLQTIDQYFVNVVGKLTNK